MQAKFFDNAIVARPQPAVDFMGDILEAQIVIPMFLRQPN
jgi:hypothetical protein